MLGGQQQAQLHLDRGEANQDLVGAIAAPVAGYLQQRGEQQALSRRDAAVDAALQSWDGQDPKALYSSLGALDPVSRMKIVEGMVSLQKLGQGDQKAEMDNWSSSVKGAAALPYAVFAKNWPTIRQTLGPGASRFLGVELPEQADEETYSAAKSLAQQFGAPAPQREKVTTRDATGAETTQFVDPAAGGTYTSSPEPPPAITPYQKESLGMERERLALARQQAAQGGAAKTYEVDVPGPNGTVVRKTFTEAEMRAGVEKAPTSTGNKPVTGQERKTLSFYNRAKQAEESIAPIEESIANAGAMGQAQLQYAPNMLQTGEQQRYRQAQRAFTEARLRVESGAAVPDNEYENDAKTYFSQPGDSDAVKAQKKTARAAVLNGLAYASGRAYEEYYGSPAPTAAKPGADAPGDIPTVSSPEEARKLGKGAQFRTPDGRVLKVP